MKISILAGGPVSLLPDISRTGNDQIWVGVDWGVQGLFELGIQPDYAFGDFDSLADFEKRPWPNEMTTFTFESEKDETDLELALDWALSMKPEIIEIYGATGGRLDHEWTNLQLLQKGIGTSTNLAIIDKSNWITVKGRGLHQIKKCKTLPYVSFFPLFESIKGFTLEGFKYSLSNAELKSGSTLTVSNELIDETGTYSLVSGIVLVIRSKDES